MKTSGFVWKFAAICFAALVLVGFPSCDILDSDIPEEERLLLKANQFVYDYTSEAYLWEQYIPSDITYKSASNPIDLFDMMKYKEMDLWSYVTDNSQEALEEFQGVATTFGYSLAFGVFPNLQDRYFAVVQYVYPNSPAEKAGLKRGDFLLTLNDAYLNKDNYMQLYYGSTIALGLGEVASDGSLGLSGKSVTMTAVKMYEDPVVDYRVIEAGDKKIGYLFYAGFYEESHQKLVEVFNGFSSAGVTELILDLRYNLGGNAKTPPYLASMIAPLGAVEQKSVFLTQRWNDLYMDYFHRTDEDMQTYFLPDIPVNLNLGRVYVLTSGSTASASEATISGLMPYMDVIKVGTSTYGKYCGAALLTPTDKNGDPDNEISNWLLSLVIYKFVNIQGFTDFKDGIAPDFEVEDDGLLAGIPLGDTADPMIARAIEHITGVKTKAPGVPVPACVVPVPHLGENPMRGGMNVVMDINVRQSN